MIENKMDVYKINKRLVIYEKTIFNDIGYTFYIQFAMDNMDEMHVEFSISHPNEAYNYWVIIPSSQTYKVAMNFYKNKNIIQQLFIARKKYIFSSDVINTIHSDNHNKSLKDIKNDIITIYDYMYNHSNELWSKIYEQYNKYYGM